MWSKYYFAWQEDSFPAIKLISLWNFPFLSCKFIQRILWNCLVFWIIWCSFVSNLQEETWTQSKWGKARRFYDNISKYRKIVGCLFKGKLYELGHFVAQLLYWYKWKGIVSVISSFNRDCVPLCKYIYLKRTIFSWVSQHENEKRLFKFTW